jgi:hypothetical protein
MSTHKLKKGIKKAPDFSEAFWGLPLLGEGKGKGVIKPEPDRSPGFPHYTWQAGNVGNIYIISQHPT